MMKASLKCSVPKKLDFWAILHYKEDAFFYSPYVDAFKISGRFNESKK